MTSQRNWRATGITLLAVGLASALLFKLLVVGPAYAPLPDGSQGEMFGPVSYFRLPVYTVCAALTLAGLACLIKRSPRRARP